MMTCTRRNLFSDLDRGLPVATKALSSLIKNGIDINAQNIEGETVCLTAIEHDKPDLCAWLIEQGSDPFIRNPHGKNVPDVVPVRMALNSRTGMEASYDKVKAAISRINKSSAAKETRSSRSDSLKRKK